MPAELRKRPAPKEDAAPAPAAKRSASKPRATTKAKQAVEKVKTAVTNEIPSTTEPTSDKPKIPDPVSDDTKTAKPTTKTSEATIPLSESSINQTLPSSSLSTPITTHTGDPQTLSSLLSSSKSGIVLFTYPKASTPGCTTQACLFRDAYSEITGAGYDVYGLSNDSPKANTTFKTKQNLPFDMLCDPDAKLTGVIGMKKPGNAKGTTRGVVVIERDGEVRVWFQGGPPKTLEAVKASLGV